jgi:hypothetical protein
MRLSGVTVVSLSPQKRNRSQDNTGTRPYNDPESCIAQNGGK